MTDPTPARAPGADQTGLRGPALLGAALELTAAAHAGQVDKAGRDYLAHPLRVAARVVDEGETAVVSALLHDVLEDSATTPADLAAAGIPRTVIDAVERLSRRDGESHADAVRRAAAHPVSAAVKRADIADNTDPERRALLPGSERARLRAKYEHAISVLDQALSGPPTA